MIDENKILKMLERTHQASLFSAQLTSKQKKDILLDVSKELFAKNAMILKENAKDLAAAKKNGLAPSMLDRLTLNEQRVCEMAEGVKMVAHLDDPIRKVLASWKRPNGLRISKVSVPIGVILIIYESRPNVTVECASLCLKSGNSVILRGGKEAFYSNKALVAIFEAVLRRHHAPQACVSFVDTTDRSVLDFLLTRDKDIHLVIPRGGESLIRKVVELSRIPVIKHYQGICHVYVDRAADIAKAVNITLNAKMQRTGVCNAAETLLVHKKIADKFLPVVGKKLQENGCELRADSGTKKILPWAKAANADDYGREFLDKILAVKIVQSLEEAVLHIQKFGSAHTDAIVTEDVKAARVFQNQVDSSSVMWNASTRFSDGFQYGFGAEIGISTDKIHARGPMGLEGLTSYKYLVEGNGQVRT